MEDANGAQDSTQAGESTSVEQGGEPQSARVIRPLADKKSKPSPQPFFRSTSPENTEDFYRQDIRDDRPRDEHGRFLPENEALPTKGALNEKKDTKPRLRPSNAPAPAPDPGPPANEEEGDENAEPAVFVPVRIGKQVFKTQKELDTHFNRITNDQKTNARRVAEMQQVLDALNQRVGLPNEDQPRVEPEKKAQEGESEITNPFLTSLLDETEENGKWWEEVGQYLGQGKQVMAFAKMAENFENRIKQLVQYIERGQTKTTEPMQAFLGALNSINQTSATFQQIAQSTDADGNPNYPLIETRQDIRDLTSIMSEHSIPLTEKGFALAYEVWSSKRNPNPRSGNPQPRYVQPDQGDDGDDHAAAAAAASVRNSSGPAVDPRAPQREPTMREQIEEMNKRGKVGMFNRMS